MSRREEGSWPTWSLEFRGQGEGCLQGEQAQGQDNKTAHGSRRQVAGGRWAAGRCRMVFWGPGMLIKFGAGGRSLGAD